MIRRTRRCADGNPETKAQTASLAKAITIAPFWHRCYAKYNIAQEPRFVIRVRARKREPDKFYANKYMKLIEDKLF